MRLVTRCEGVQSIVPELLISSSLLLATSTVLKTVRVKVNLWAKQTSKHHHYCLKTVRVKVNLWAKQTSANTITTA